MNAKEKREYVIEYLKDEDLVSDEAVDILLKLMSRQRIIHFRLHRRMFNKKEILEMAGMKDRHYDTAYPQPYADKIRELYPDFNEGLYIFDYTEERFGRMVNVYNQFAKKILTVFG